MQLRPFVSVLKSYFHRRALERNLRAAEAELRAAQPEQKGILLDRLGDLHLELGEEREALMFFGGAIDACLAAGHLDSAAALCRKMVSVCPQVVRAHGTLGCLLLARGSIRQAEWELVQYVQASRREGTSSYAQARLRMLVRAFPDHDARLLLARLLRQMGDAETAHEIEESLDPDLSPKRQRRMLASLLRRQVQPGMPMDTEEPIEVVEEIAEPERGLELPYIDTTVVRAARPASPSIRPSAAIDLPWLDVTLADEVAGVPELLSDPPVPAEPLAAAAPEERHAALSDDDCARLADTIVGAIRKEIVLAEAMRLRGFGSFPRVDADEPVLPPAHRAPEPFAGPRSLRLRLSPDGTPVDDPVN